MKGSSGRGLEVFDFREDDDLCESVQKKYSGKIKNPSSGSNPTLKFKIVGNVSRQHKVQEKDISGILCLDDDAVNSEHCCDNAISHSPLETIEEKVATNKEHLESDAAPQLEFLSHDERSDSKLGSHGSRTFLFQDGRSSTTSLSSGKNQLHCTQAVSPSNNGQLDVISDADESQSDSLSSSASEIEDDDVSSDAYNFDLLGFEMDNVNMTVVLYPDYVVYRDSYCTEPQLTFSHSCIKFSSSEPSELCETLSSEWGVDDLVDIDCRWYQKAELVMIKLCVRSKDAAEDDNAHSTTVPGIEELKIAVVEPNWSQKQQRIACLNEKYKNVWAVQDMDKKTDGDDSDGQRPHFPNFDEPFEDVIYPKGDSDAVSISKRDVDLLQPETFINDTIIDFYIKYLKNQIQAEEKHRFHFFNSFFFRKLADLDKDPSSIADGRAAFQRVRKWTRKVDLFEKEYIFIPINFNLHWSLIVICHLGEVPRLTDGDLDKSLKVPCILHMDSIKGTHSGLKNLIQSYLWEEWKERKKETSEEISSKFHNLRFVPLELPQQENSFDCGLFLLHYLELFLADAPACFSPLKITKFSNFLNPNWFPPSEASIKRTLIQRLIFELLQNRYREASSAASSDKDQAKFSEFNEHEIGVQSFSRRFSPTIACRENISSSPAGQGIEMTLLSTSSLRNSECVNDSGLVLRDLFEPGATAGSPFRQFHSFDPKSSGYHLNGAITPLEEATGTGEHFGFLPAGDSNFQQITEITHQTSGIPYTDRAYGAETSYDLGICEQVEHENIELSPELSIRPSDHTEDIGADKIYPVVEDLGLSQKMDVDNCPPVENVRCLTDGLVCAIGKMQNISIMKHCENAGTIENHPLAEDLGPTQKMDGDNCPPLENFVSLRNGLVSTSGKMLNDTIIEVSEDRGTLEDLDPSRNEVDVSNCPLVVIGTCLPDGLVSASRKMHNAVLIEVSGNIGTNECHPVGDDLVSSQKEVDVRNSPSEEKGTENVVSASGKMQNASIIEGSEDIGTEENHPLLENGTNHLVSASREMQNASIVEGSEDRTNESHPAVEDLVPDEMGVGCPSVEKVTCSTGDAQDAPIIEGSEAHYNVHGNDEKGGPLSSCQENSGITNQDFDMVNTAIASSGDAQKLDDRQVPDSHERQATKRQQLTAPLEGEKCDDVQILDDGPVPESQEQLAGKRPRLTPPLEGEKCDDVKMLDGGPVSELQEQQAAKRLRLTPPHEGAKCDDVV